MNRFVKGLIGIGFAFAGTQASAALIEDLGIVPSLEAGDNETIVFSDVPAPGLFDDTWTFTLQGESLVDISITRLPLQQAGVDFLLIEDFDARLLDSDGNVLADVMGDAQSPDLTFAPGMYTIQMSGNAIGLAGGAYLGALVVTTSPIPIPAAGLLFFSGMAALGFVRARRSKA